MSDSTFVDDTAEGSSFLPDSGLSGRGGVPVTKANACPAFLLAFDPGRWTVMAGKVIPALIKVAMVGGLNGADDVRDREGKIIRQNMGTAKAHHEDKGRKIIPVQAVPTHLLRPGQTPSYLWQPKGRADVHLHFCERCYPGSEQVDCDEAKYTEWCQWLQDEGYITPPPSHVLRHMLATRQAEAARLADQAVTVPSRKPQAAAAQAVCEVIAAELDRRALQAPPATPSEGSGFTPEDD